MDFEMAIELNALAALDRALLTSPQPPGQCVDFLQRVNRAGYLTARCVHGDRFEDRDERAFVEGFMSRSRAAAFVDTLNTSADKVAMVIHPVKRALPASRIPVVFESGLSRAGVDLYRSPAQIQALRKRVGLCAEADVAYVVCVDPLWGRPSTAPDGLLQEILAVLKS